MKKAIIASMFLVSATVVQCGWQDCVESAKKGALQVASNPCVQMGTTLAAVQLARGNGLTCPLTQDGKKNVTLAAGLYGVAQGLYSNHQDPNNYKKAQVVLSASAVALTLLRSK